MVDDVGCRAVLGLASCHGCRADMHDNMETRQGFLMIPAQFLGAWFLPQDDGDVQTKSKMRVDAVL